MHREEDVVVGGAGCAQLEQAAADRELIADAAEVLVTLPDLRRLDGPKDGHELGIGLAQHEGAARLHDPRLLRGDVGTRRADDLLMVEAHVRHHGHLRVGDVGRVPATAESHLHYRNVDRDVGEPAERGGGEDLESGRRLVESQLELCDGLPLR